MPEQAVLLAQLFGCVRFVWNSTLAYRTETYQLVDETNSKDCLAKIRVNLRPMRAEIQAGTAKQL